MSPLTFDLSPEPVRLKRFAAPVLAAWTLATPRLAVPTRWSTEAWNLGRVGDGP